MIPILNSFLDGHKYYYMYCLDSGIMLFLIIGLDDQSMGLNPLQQCGIMTGGRGAFFPDQGVCAFKIM